MRATLLLLVAALSLIALGAASADPTVGVTFPEKGAYIWWLEYKDALGKPQVAAPKHTRGAGTSVDLSPAVPSGKPLPGLLKVYDPKSGNVAAKNLENLADAKELKLKSADFDLVRTARLILKPAEGKPNERVESAVVTLKDANSDEFTAIVDPLSEGVAEFHDIAGGLESVTVDYDGGRMTIDVEAPIERDNPVFTHVIAISADVRTVKPSAASTQTTSAEQELPEQQQARRSRSGAAGIIAGFAFLAMVGGVAYVVLKAKGTTLKDGLEKLGVALPKAEDDGQIPEPPAPQVDPNICPFCGQRKDPETGKCGCSVDSQPSGGMGAAGVPRLIGVQGPYSGHIFELVDDVTVIGRDSGNAIPLDQDATTSRKHARINKDNGAFVITDEGSSNGTFVNGLRVEANRELRPGDEVQIGSTKFRFEL
ncbi:MAG: FHA domain-containing protein [Armatimonadetes bacterium]|nr:FHA domain-containing protein [Armatimonadota bacterium]